MILQSILSKIGLGIATILVAVSGFLGYPVNQGNFGATVPIVTATFSTTLASAITSTATDFTLTSGTTADGTTLNGVYGFVIDSSTSSEEFVLATCVNTACSGATRGVSVITGNTSIVALKKSHSRGASVKISDHPQLAIISRIVNGNESFPNALSFDGLLSYVSPAETPVYAYDIPSKGYVDNAVVSGAANADLTTKGISEEATASEINAGTQAGGTLAELFVNPKYLKDSNYYSYLPTADQKDALAGTSGTPSSSNKYCTNDDTATAATASKIARRLAGGNITVITESQGNNSTNAASTAYVDAGLGTKYPASGGLGSWASATVDGAGHQVTTDALLVGYAAGVGGAPTIDIYVDTNSTPTTQRYKAGNGNMAASFTVPIKKNEYYKIVASTYSVTAYIIPIGN